MKYILAFFLTLGTAYGQSATVNITNDGITLQASNRFGKQLGYFRFDSISGQITRSGNQVACFRWLIAYHRMLIEKTELLEAVADCVADDGTIRYPIEFKTAWINYIKKNQRQ